MEQKKQKKIGMNDRYTETGIKDSVKKEAHVHLIRYVMAFIVAASGFLGSLSFYFEWLTPETIGSFEILLYAAVGLGYTLYEIYQNKFATKKGQEQNADLKRNGLKK